MAEKNWLIRTKNKQILGPATKQKVIELIEKGSLTSDDEVTCGNGYWFWIKEQDLIDKYLYGDLPQSFNPISEAEDVLTAKTSPEGITSSVTDTPGVDVKAKKEAEPQVSDHLLPDDDELAYPDEDDLDYPDRDEMALDTAPGDELELKDLSELDDEAEAEEELTPRPTTPPAPQSMETETGPLDGEENFLYPPAADLEYPTVEEVEDEDEDVTDPNVKIPGIQPEECVSKAAAPEKVEAPAPPPPRKKKAVKKKRKIVTERKGNDRYLFLILAFIIVAIGIVFYYYSEVLNKPFPTLGISDAQAQTLQSLSKKKVF